jgi:hypothetical protein
MDANASWRNKPVDMESAQVAKAVQMRIEVDPGMTKGQLSNLIDEKIRLREERKTKKSKKAERIAQ